MRRVIAFGLVLAMGLGVPAGALAVARGEQRVVEGYRERKDAQQKASQRKGGRAATGRARDQKG